MLLGPWARHTTSAARTEHQDDESASGGEKTVGFVPCFQTSISSVHGITWKPGSSILLPRCCIGSDHRGTANLWLLYSLSLPAQGPSPQDASITAAGDEVQMSKPLLASQLLSVSITPLDATGCYRCHHPTVTTDCCSGLGYLLRAYRITVLSCCGRHLSHGSCKDISCQSHQDNMAEKKLISWRWSWWFVSIVSKNLSLSKTVLVYFLWSNSTGCWKAHRSDILWIYKLVVADVWKKLQNRTELYV